MSNFKVRTVFGSNIQVPSSTSETKFTSFDDVQPERPDSVEESPTISLGESSTSVTKKQRGRPKGSTKTVKTDSARTQITYQSVNEVNTTISPYLYIRQDIFNMENVKDVENGKITLSTRDSSIVLSVSRETKVTIYEMRGNSMVKCGEQKLDAAGYHCIMKNCYTYLVIVFE